MAYTSEDLAQVRKAILDLASGTRVASITHNGRTVQYSGSGDLSKLRELERTIAASLIPAKNRRSRTRSVLTSKGL